MRTPALAPELASTFTKPTNADTAPQARKPGFLRRLLNGLIASREQQARRVVLGQLAHLDDAKLAKIGWTAADVAALRHAEKTGQLPI
jgi:hypothetical protein